MKHKLKITDGKVAFLLRTGKDLVRNEMAGASAQHIINTGEIKESAIEGYPINVDDKWYFEGEAIAEKQKRNSLRDETEEDA